MEKIIIDLLHTYELIYIPISQESLKNIYELLINDKKFKPITDIDMLYTGVYWKIKNGSNKMVKYYLLASENIGAVVNLAKHYRSTLDYDNAIKYYLITFSIISSKILNCKIQISNIDDMTKYCPTATEVGHNLDYLMHNLMFCYILTSKFNDAIKCYFVGIEKGYDMPLNNLAYCYEELFKYDEAVKYYLMGIENGDADAINNLAYCYEKMLKYDDAVKYYLMAIEKGCVTSMFNLAHYYEKISKFDDAIKYYSIAVKNGDTDAMKALDGCVSYYEIQSYSKDAIKYYLMAAECGSKISLAWITKYYLVGDNFDERFFVYLKLEQSRYTNIFKNIRSMYINIINILVLHFEYSPGTDKFKEVEREFKKHKFM